MKHGSNTRRPRGGRNNGHRSNNNNSRSRVFDSNGPDVRIRGNAGQVHEKYVALARDASSSGDHVLAESYLQHAEHYQRVLNEVQAPREPQKNVPPQKIAQTGTNPTVKETPIVKTPIADTTKPVEKVAPKTKAVKKPEMA